jgi:hypothetical protein
VVDLLKALRMERDYRFNIKQIPTWEIVENLAK